MYIARVFALKGAFFIISAVLRQKLTPSPIFFTTVLKALLAYVPLTQRYIYKVFKGHPLQIIGVIAVLFLGAFFIAPAISGQSEAEHNYFAVIGETIFSRRISLADRSVTAVEQVQKSQDGATISSEPSSLPPRETASQGKTPSAPLANLVMLTTDQSLVAAPPLAALDAEYSTLEEGGFFMDALPTVNGVAFMEAMGPQAVQRAAERTEIYTYTVEEGDTPAEIAELFGVSLETLLWANNLTSRSVIRTGQQLTVLPVNGIQHAVIKGDTLASLAKKYQADMADIIAFNNLAEGEALAVGNTLVIPDGVKPAPAPVVPRIVNITKQVAHTPTGWLIQPASGRNWGRLHGFGGVDVANKCGTPVVAAAAGTVIVADDSGWNGGYGKYIKLQHDNGVITLYAHSMELLVDVGVRVNQGESIMLMGTTGRSTGCHVHFEVRGSKNPFVWK